MNLIDLLSFTGTLKTIGGFLLAIVILLAMVTIHEFGHYVAGKALGFKINEFSVGFGPALFKRRSKKTGELFALRLVPLGGYCAFDGEDEVDDEEEKKPDQDSPFEELPESQTGSQTENDGVGKKEEFEYPQPRGERFNDQPPWKRIIVLIAGATMNYLLAVCLIILMFASVGRPLYSVMERPAEVPPAATEYTLIDETPVEKELLAVGDVILKIDGRNVYMITDYIDALDGKKAGEWVPVTVLRGEEKRTVWIQLAKNADFKNLSDTETLLHSMGIYGLAPTIERQGFFPTIGHSFGYSVKIGGTVLRSLGELLTGKIGIKSMGGPVTTISVTAEAASSGWLSFLNIAAFIGVNLAVFNLLPVPALDGSKVIFCLIEWIRKKPVNRKVESMIHFIGILFLFGFAILVDLLHLF
ncbi:MAG: site-2 protease family protein [Clostridia bacterium]|nr:site-2 protease family protein [Clostridia bacterium]MBQ9729175.1 site-2 protease family protein [Clostridia bacterium]